MKKGIKESALSSENEEPPSEDNEFVYNVVKLADVVGFHSKHWLERIVVIAVNTPKSQKTFQSSENFIPFQYPSRTSTQRLSTTFIPGNKYLSKISRPTQFSTTHNRCRLFHRSSLTLPPLYATLN